MSGTALLESFQLFHGRNLQELPDYTSPPLPVALAATPELYRNDSIVQLARDVADAGNCTVDGNRCHIPFASSAEESKVGVLFYNGGLVDPRGYAPMAQILSQRYGMPVVLPIFASDLAFQFGTCDTGRLELAQAEFPQVEKWVLAGHSFGGVAAMVDVWTRWNADDEAVAGLALVAADVQQGLLCGDTDFSTTDLPMAQVLGTNDGVLNMTRTNMNVVLNSNATQVIEIFGANHASFGDYDDSERGTLFGQNDGEALIPDSVVWDITAAAIVAVAARAGAPLPTVADEDTQNKTDQVQCPPSGTEPNASGEAGVVSGSVLKVASVALFLVAAITVVNVT